MRAFSLLRLHSHPICCNTDLKCRAPVGALANQIRLARFGQLRRRRLTYCPRKWLLTTLLSRRETVNRLKMADLKTCPPLDRASVQTAHKRIHQYIHRTPVVTCATIDDIASIPQSERCPSSGPNKHCEPAPHDSSINGSAKTCAAKPKFRLFFKCENQQRVGAFKARGAFHALGRLIEEEGLDNVRQKGVVTHSSGTFAISAVQHHC